MALVEAFETRDESVKMSRFSSAQVVGLVEGIVLSLFVALYVVMVSRHFWTLPAPSDPLQYLGSTVWKSTWGYWPWLDRIMLAVNLRVFTMFFSEPYVGGLVYVGGVNTAILAISIAWAYRNSGFLAAVFIAVFLNTSFMTLGWATYLYPDQTVALFSLIAFILFSYAGEALGKKHQMLIFAAGFFGGLASFTKIMGVVIPLCLGGGLIIRRQWRSAVVLLLGALSAAVFAVVAFCCLYNVESFVNVCQLFFKNSIKDNLNVPYSNAFTYHSLLLSMRFFPFVALFIAIGAYSNNTTRRLFLLAWAFIGFIYLVKTLGVTGGPPIPSYIHSAFVFLCLGLAIHLGDVVSYPLGANDSPNSLRPRILLVVLSGFVGLLIVAGLGLGIRFPSIDNYEYGFNYFTPLSVFDSSSKMGGAYPGYIIVLFSLGPICVLGLLLLSEISRSRRVILLFLVVSSFWMAFFNGGLAYRKALFDREEARYYYKVAPALNEIPSDRFSFFTKGVTARTFDRVTWVYRLFFDHKYPRGTSYNSQYENDALIRTNITYVSQENELPQVQGTHIVTDSPEAVLRYYPKAQLTGKIKWNKAELSVIDIRARANDGKDPVPEP